MANQVVLMQWIKAFTKFAIIMVIISIIIIIIVVAGFVIISLFKVKVFDLF